MFAIISFSVGVLLIILGIQKEKIVSKCNTEIKAVCIGSKSIYYGHGISKYSPVFRYNYGGQQYERSSFQHFSKKYVDSVYQQGQEYSIYINPDKPLVFKVIQKKEFFVLVTILTGIYLILASMFFGLRGL